MQKLDEKNRLFQQLEKNPPNWWNLLVSDKDIYIDIRKDNYIDSYYNGGGLLRNLKHSGIEYKGKTNYKYLLRGKSENVNYSIADNSFAILNTAVKLLHFNNLDSKTLHRIKTNISKYYPANSEKGIQARFIRNAGRFIDSEFAYNYDNIKLRIDLVWIDKKQMRIQFIELKTIGDSRLFTDEITNQLSKYFHFADQFETSLLSYYQKLFRIKKKLKILPTELQKLDSLDDFKIEKKPLLLFGDCNQEWIEKNADNINQKIKKVAIGAYYFGSTSYNCDVIDKAHERNRFIFK